MKTYKSKGIISLKGPFNIVYKLCEIEYILYEDETFEYDFTPNYCVMSLMSSYYFQGIPGLNLDLKKEKYIRKNIIIVNSIIYINIFLFFLLNMKRYYTIL